MDGFYKKVCQNPGCDIWEYSDVIPAFGHGNWWYDENTRINATCTEDGSVIRVCNNLRPNSTDVCNHTEREVLPAGHKFELTEVRSAICETDGAEFYGCVNDGCNEWYYGEITKATGHTLELVETRHATCEADGAQYYSCTNKECNHWEYGDIYHALGHVFSYWQREDGQWFKNCTRENCGHWDYADAPMIVSVETSAKSIISLKETSKNIWTVTFSVTETYDNGDVKNVEHEIVIGKNSGAFSSLNLYIILIPNN